MAAYKRVYNFLCSLFISACLFQPRCLPLVRADQALINNVCSKTGGNRQLCLDCFRTPGSQNLDVRGLAKSSISCASTTSFDARQATSDLGSRSSGSLKQNSIACVGLLDKTLLEFNDAGNNVGAARYGDAINQLNQANSQAQTCLNTVGSGNVPGLATLKGDIQVAINIINQIPK